MMATILCNLSTYVDNRLAERLHVDEVDWSAQEFLHAVRQVDPSNVPEWETPDPGNGGGWTLILVAITS